MLLSSPVHLRPPMFLPIHDPSLQIRKRRRLKVLRRAAFPAMSLSFEDLFHSLVSTFPSVNSLDLLVPALGFASGAALYVISSQRRKRKELDGGAAGDWILFSSPTPFNRSVLLRCPSLSFEHGGELLDGLNERLVEKERHYVSLGSGRIPLAKESGRVDDEVSFQRVCIGTDDGGVISLDWPESLDLEKEEGLDNTVMLVPGTAEGSMDRDVRAFVSEALSYGCFPVVMNPRGCAGSPLTTPRLFTAADSDGICTAVQFIKRSRPWTTLMSVGWGYGANMLTKYLSENGDQTPLTAAVCINNPFDLQEATMSHPHNVAMNQKLTDGLVEILQANKEVFQGKSKGFDVSSGLSAKSVRDFDSAISMISYGFQSIEEFYSKCSTRQLVGSLKIPVLFIQGDDETVPFFSIPRSSITENPYSNLLICSSLSSNFARVGSSAVIWYQHLAMEWLQAVEVALLKGRHPLLEDIDISLNPSGSLNLIGTKNQKKDLAESKNARSYIPGVRKFDNGKHLLKPPQLNDFTGYSAGPLNYVLEGSSGAEQVKSSGHETTQTEEVNGIDISQNATLINVADRDECSIDKENRQVLATAEVVLNMLDASMPGCIDSEHRKKVLTAVEQGQTLVKALQKSVPENVRGKITGTISEIVQSQSNNLNPEWLMKLGWDHNFKLEIKSKKEEIETIEFHDQRKTIIITEQHGNTEKLHSDSDYIGENGIDFREKPSKSSEFTERGSEFEDYPNEPNKAESSDNKMVIPEPENIVENHKASMINEGGQMMVKESNDITNNIPELGMSESGESKQIVPPNSGDALSHPCASDQQTSDRKQNDAQEKGNPNEGDMASQQVYSSSTESENQQSPNLSSKPPPINVSEALDAFKSFDDSTQMAVNSVFGVIENMIDQLEKKTDNNDKEENEAADQKAANISEPLPVNIYKSDNTDNSNYELSLNSDPFILKTKSKTNSDRDETCHQVTEIKQEDESGTCVPSPFTLNGVDLSSGNNASIYHPNINNLKGESVNVYPSQLIAEAKYESSYKAYLHRYFYWQMSYMKSVNLQAATDLFLDPQKGQWMMQAQMLDGADNGKSQKMKLLPREADREKVTEPSYVTLVRSSQDSEERPIREFETTANIETQDTLVDAEKKNFIFLARASILDALKVEAARKLGTTSLDEIEPNLASEVEKVADTVAHVLLYHSDISFLPKDNDPDSLMLGTVRGRIIVNSILSAIQNADSLRKIIPVGVIVGSCLASLREYFTVTAEGDGEEYEVRVDDVLETSSDRGNDIDNGYCSSMERGGHAQADTVRLNDERDVVNTLNDNVMVGAVSAIVGASALLALRQKNESHETIQADANSNAANSVEKQTEGEEAAKDNDQNNLVSTITEKALSVASPIVPTKGGGELDEERLLSFLSELGQKGGLLSFFGNVALLWGGIRGALSLTDRLIKFLRIGQRPLSQRVLGFACMVLVLWSPVAVPLLPKIIQSWSNKSSTGIAAYACVLGLHVAILILIMLWGKRIRGYETPLKQYGLDLTSASKVHDFVIGLVGGIVLVLSVHLTNTVLGYACFTRPPSIPSSSVGATLFLKEYGKIIFLSIRGIITATCVATVEELLFRSWFPDEIAVDLGYPLAILISGLAFSLLQRSLSSIPGSMFLSLALFGAKRRKNGSLYIPIGIRTGIMVVSFMTESLGFILYKPGAPFFLMSTHSWHPFDGAIGTSLCIVLAMLLYPWQPLQEKNISQDSQ